MLRPLLALAHERLLAELPDSDVRTAQLGGVPRDLVLHLNVCADLPPALAPDAYLSAIADRLVPGAQQLHPRQVRLVCRRAIPLPTWARMCVLPLAVAHSTLGSVRSAGAARHRA